MNASASPRLPGASRSAWLVFAAALAIRLIALWASSDAELVKDEIAYAARAEALLDGKGYLGSYQSWVRHEGWRIMDLPQYPGAYQPPGYPTLMAGILAVSGRSLLAVKLVQCVLSALSCVLLLRLGRAWFSERVGLLASGSWALYPNSIAFTHLLWSETLYTFLVLAFLDLLSGNRSDVHSDDRTPLPRWGRCAGAGVVLALAALTRGTTVFLAPVLAFWMLLLASGNRGLPRLRAIPWRDGSLRVAVVLGVALACIAPWTARNYEVHGGFVLIDTNAPYNLWRGNAPSAMALRGVPQAQRYSPPFDGILLHPVGNLNGRELIDAYRRDRSVGGEILYPTDLEVMAYASEVAWREIRNDPARALRHAGWKWIDMWNPTSFLIRHFEMGAYGDVPSALRIAITFAAAASYLVIVFFAVFGAVAERTDRRVWLILTIVAYFSAISALAFGLTRFRLPLMPLLTLLAAVELARFRRARREALPGPAQGDRDDERGTEN